MSAPPEISAVDPFDLPDWLGVNEVTWLASQPLTGRSRIGGTLSADGERLACDLLAVDQAFPEPVVPERWRREAHAQWARGEVLALQLDGTLTLVAPGQVLSADLVLVVIGRLARAVGVSPGRFLAALRA